MTTPRKDAAGSSLRIPFFSVFLVSWWFNVFLFSMEIFQIVQTVPALLLMAFGLFSVMIAVQGLRDRQLEIGLYRVHTFTLKGTYAIMVAYIYLLSGLEMAGFGLLFLGGKLPDLITLRPTMLNSSETLPTTSIALFIGVGAIALGNLIGLLNMWLLGEHASP
jgi:hypothetical protein